MSDKNGAAKTTSFPRSGGVATIVHGSCPGVETASVIASKTIPNRYLLVKLRLGDQVCYIHNIYAPNDAASRKALFERLPVGFDDDVIHIVCGDFNLAIEPEVDSLMADRRPDSSVPVLRDWLVELNVVDAWRLHHPNEKLFSGPRPRRNRLDYIFASDTLISTCYQDAGYETWDESDHKAHNVELTSWHHPTGPGFWRLSDWLLRIPELRADIQKEAQNLLSILETSTNPGIVWKSWKQRMKAYLKKCQRDLKSSVASELVAARQHLEESAAASALENDSERATLDLYFAKQRYKECKEEWSEFQRGVGFEQLVTETEQSSSFFFRAPRYELRNTPFQSIKREDGSVSTDPAEITQGFQKHWGEIFGDTKYSKNDHQPDEAAQHRLLDSIDRTLTPEAADGLERDLSSTELSAAIRSMKKHSAPGPDGFTSTFYQIDPDLFGNILRIVFCYQLERGELLPHQRFSSVALLFKKGDRADPGNFRPITLIPVEVKILSRVLTDRLRPFMSSLVHPDQKGFIPGRSIHQQVMLVRDLQHLVTCGHRQGVAAFLDFAKAYDRVNRNYLFKVMERQGFGKHFLSWIHLLYKGSKCSLMINGWAQDALEPSRGVKQGDPLSPFLFALSLEPLGNLLREKRAFGVRVDDTLSIPVAFFADDTVLFANDASSLKNELQLVDCYCAGSGAKLNHSKSVIMSLNNRRKPPILEPLRSLKKGDTVKYLGLPFGNLDTSTQLAKQLDHKLMTRLQLWKGRARTLIGRRLIVQAIVLSTIWYFTTTTVIPTRFIKRWQSAVKSFILYNRVGDSRGGINIVPTSFAIQARQDDGIGVPVIMSCIRRQRFLFLQKFVKVLACHNENKETVWYRPIAELLRHRYGEFVRPWSGEFLLQNPPEPPGWKATMLPLWWRKLLQDWSRVKWPSKYSLRYTRMKTLQHSLFSPIWWNTATNFQVQRRQDPHRAPLGTGPIKFRRLCKELASKGKWCLADFLDTCHRWPTLTIFFRTVSTELRPILGSRIALTDITQLYRQLTQIFERVLPHPEAGGISVATRGAMPPTFGLTVGKTSRFFPNLKSPDWDKLLRSDRCVQPHPMKVLGCPQQQIHSTLQQVLALRQFLVPVVHDVMLRLFFGDLIVGSRLFFLKSLNPTIQQCVRRSCAAMETLEHCFFSCPALTQMWTTLWSPWHKAFATELDWRLLLFPKPRDLNMEWRQNQKVFLLLWRVYTAIAFHATWRLRNDILFRETTAQVPSVQNVTSSFRRHCQYINHHSAELGIDDKIVTSVLEKLGFDPPAPRNTPPASHVWIPRN